MLTGILCALGAGLMWGLVFITPLMLPDYPGMMLSFGRFLAFGLIVLLPAALDRKRLASLTRADWLMATKLSLIGNLLYYAALASAIQLADAPVPVMLIGSLPVIISVYSNWTAGAVGESVAWRRLLPSLLIILLGLLLVNASELGRLDGQHSLASYIAGILLALVALAAWTWYPVTNARYLKAHPHISSTCWSTVQGLVTLPMALLGLVGYGLYNHASGGTYDFPLGPQPARFIALMLTIGLCASWLGILLWNRASKNLPTSLAGQLITFETLAALLYVFLWRGAMPALPVLLGSGLLCLGVLWGTRVFRVVPMPTAA